MDRIALIQIMAFQSDLAVRNIFFTYSHRTLKPHHQCAIGPTGIIGRPTGPLGGINGYGGSNGYGNEFGPLGGHIGNVPGAFNGGIGNGFAGPYRPSGPGVGIPYNSNGANGRPYAAEFDDYDNGVDKKKHVEKKSIDEKN